MWPVKERPCAVIGVVASHKKSSQLRHKTPHLQGKLPGNQLIEK
jgi:hypothetical protein